MGTMHVTTTTTPPEASRRRRALALMLAARAECDWRTARRALLEGPDAIRTETVRTRIAMAMAELGLSPLEASAHP